MGGGGRGAMERERSGAEPGRTRLGQPGLGALPALAGVSLCLETRRPEPEICREVQQLRGPRATETRLFMADPPSGGALGRWGPGRGGRGEGPRRGRGRRTSPPDRAAARESQARLRVSASRDSPRRDPREPGLDEVAVSAHGAPRGPAPASRSRDLGALVGRRGGEKEGKRETGIPRPPPLVAPGLGRWRDPLSKCPAGHDRVLRARAGPAPSHVTLRRSESLMQGTPTPSPTSGKGAGRLEVTLLSWKPGNERGLAPYLARPEAPGTRGPYGEGGRGAEPSG